MANNPFDRTILNPLERPVSVDYNQLQSQGDRSIRHILKALFSANPLSGTNGFLNASFQVVPTSPLAMTVNVNPGAGFIDAPGDVPSAISGIAGLDDLSSYKPVTLSAQQLVNIDAAPPGGQNRIDIIEVKYDRRVENPSTRDVLNVGTGIFVPGSLNKTLAFDLTGRTGRVVTPSGSTAAIGYKVGAAATAGSEVAPATTSGYVKLAEIHVIGGVTSIDSAHITDFRPSLLVVTAALANTFTALQTFSAGLDASAIEVDSTSQNPGGLSTYALRFGGGSGEGIYSRRVVGDPSYQGLNFVAGSVSRLSLLNGGDIDCHSNPVHNVASPSASGDAANKGYVDAADAATLASAEAYAGTRAIVTGRVTAAGAMGPYTTTGPVPTVTKNAGSGDYTVNITGLTANGIVGATSEQPSTSSVAGSGTLRVVTSNSGGAIDSNFCFWVFAL